MLEHEDGRDNNVKTVETKCATHQNEAGWALELNLPNDQSMTTYTIQDWIGQHVRVSEVSKEAILPIQV